MDGCTELFLVNVLRERARYHGMRCCSAALLETEACQVDILHVLPIIIHNSNSLMVRRLLTQARILHPEMLV